MNSLTNLHLKKRSVALSAAVLALTLSVAQSPDRAGAAVNPAFTGQAMWIWQLPKTEGGSVARIVARAKANNISAVYVKSADAGTRWQQFTPEVVSQLEAAGLKVCGWQFVYGARPAAEASAGAAAKEAGADCLIIDADSSYEGRYRSAATYMASLRKKVGRSYPLGFTSFPYVDFHPSLPYSTFLGSGGAQVNMPQVYWRDIGTSVSTAMRHTWRENRIYGRPIVPIGQTYQSAPVADIARFRAMAAAWEAPGYSWWEWSTTSARQWAALASRTVSRINPGDPGWPTLRRGSKGDSVVQAQKLLRAAGNPALKASGIYDAATVSAVSALQENRGIPVDGILGSSTWPSLLKVAAAKISARNARADQGPVPRSASIVRDRNEIRPAG